MKWFRNISSGLVEAWSDDSARADLLSGGEGQDGFAKRTHEEVTVSGDSPGGSNPFVGDVVKLTGTTSQSIPDSAWTQLDLSAHAVVTNPQAWASVVGTDLVIDPTAGILVVTQGWIVWATSAVGAVRALLIAHGGGGTPEFLDDMPIMLTPDQYAALSDFEGSMGGEVTNRVDPTDGLSLQFWVYQDSGGALNCDFGISFVTPIA